MSTDTPFTRENLNTYLKELAKEFKKLNGKKMPAEIVLIGGAAILANYGFREATYDIDAIVLASSAMKEAINHVGDKLGLPNGWLNTDFKKTNSFSDKLLEISVYYKTFSNIITVRTVAAEYLIAMKLMSGRQYKYDLSDVAGILWEHQKSGNPISRDAIDKAIITLYGEAAILPDVSQKTIGDAFTSGDYEKAYREIREGEKQAKDILLDFDKAHPGELKGENINAILERAKRNGKRKYTHVIWDWNGTLLDDVELGFSTINALLKKRHLCPLEDIDAYRDIFGFPVIDYYRRAGFDFSAEPFEVAATEYIELYHSDNSRFRLFGGVPEILASIKEMGLRQAILSASEKNNLLSQVGLFGIEQYFDDIIGICDIYAGSKTDAGQKYIAQSGTDRSKTVMFGDTVHDHETAKALGVDCILIANGHQNRQKLLGCGVRVLDGIDGVLAELNK